ncbi:MAG TPA: DUF4242 domain-containing protein [Thermoanaerobaculia bacterium]|nr:DUF4242 domain-containing protein [Thermoanaerobaculia bacterium]
MPRYLIERHVGQLSEQELEAAAARSLAVLREMSGVTWIKSHVSAAEGKIFCEYEAADEQRILEHARRAGLPADKITEIRLTISPDMFQ